MAAVSALRELAQPPCIWKARSARQYCKSALVSSSKAFRSAAASSCRRSSSKYEPARIERTPWIVVRIKLQQLAEMGEGLGPLAAIPKAHRQCELRAHEGPRSEPSPRLAGELRTSLPIALRPASIAVLYKLKLWRSRTPFSSYAPRSVWASAQSGLMAMAFSGRAKSVLSQWRFRKRGK